MADTTNRKSVPPSFDGLTPKEMRRAWLRFMADQEFVLGDTIYAQAEYVRITIDMLILNTGEDAETWVRQELSRQLALFTSSWGKPEKQ